MKNRLRDIFYISRWDRNASIFLIVLIIVINTLRLVLLSERERVLRSQEYIPADSLHVAVIPAPRTEYPRAPSSSPPSRDYTATKGSKSLSPGEKRGEFKRDSSSSLQRDTTIVKYRKKLAPTEWIDINLVDSVGLIRLPGIGPYYAKRILDYRERLGGFVDVAQIAEVVELSDSVVRWFTLSDSLNIRSLDINRLSLNELRQHPYINFYQARDIYEYRYKEGKIVGPEQLLFLKSFTEQDLVRLIPYITF